MEQHILHALATYNTYANRVILDTAAQVSDIDLACIPSPSRGSILVLIRHFLTVEAHYLAACQERIFHWDPLAYPSLSELQSLATDLGEEATQLVAELGEEGADRIVPLQLAEYSFHFPIWQLLLQVFLHSSEHRGELSILFSNLEHPLAINDPIAQFAKESAQPWPWG